jgi:hypothetical protein
VAKHAPHEVVSLHVAWPSFGLQTVRAAKRLLDRLSRLIAALPGGARVLVAHGTAPDAIYIRPGCVVLGDRGVRGDERYGALWQRFAQDGLERLQFLPPGGHPARDATLELTVARAPKYAAGSPAVEVSCCLGRALGGPSASGDLLGDSLAEVLRSAVGATGFVASHPWVPSFMERTPWEQDGSAGAHRVDPARAWALRCDARHRDAVTTAVAGPSERLRDGATLVLPRR